MSTPVLLLVRRNCQLPMAVFSVVQCPLPDLNGQLTPDLNSQLPQRTSTASSRWQCSPPDLNRQLGMALFPAGPQPLMSDRMSEFMSDRMSKSMSYRLSESVSDRMSASMPIECQNLCQIECHNLCPIEGQNLCPIEGHNLCEIECQNLCQIDFIGVTEWKNICLEVQLLARMLVTSIPICCYRKSEAAWLRVHFHIIVDLNVMVEIFRSFVMHFLNQNIW